MSYIGHARKTISELCAISIPVEVSVSIGGSSVDQGQRLVKLLRLPLEHRSLSKAALFSGGGTADFRIIQWDMISGSILRTFPRGNTDGSALDREGHMSGVTAILTTEAYGLHRLFSASLDGTVRLLLSESA